MKHLFTLIVLTFVTNAFALIHTPYSNSFKNDGSVEYRDKVFIQVKAGEAITKGACVAMDTAADNGITVKNVALSAAVAVPHCIAAETIASGKMGKCQVYGYSDAILFEPTTTAVAGEAIYCGSTVTAGKMIAIASGSVAAYNTPVGSFLDASAATASVEGFINLL